LDATGRGVYRELLDHCYAKGEFPDDQEWICRRCACTTEQFEKVWPLLQKHFPISKTPGYRWNVPANIVRREYFRYVDGQRKKRKNAIDKANREKESRELASTENNSGQSADQPNGKLRQTNGKLRQTNGKLTANEAKSEVEDAPPPEAIAPPKKEPQPIREEPTVRETIIAATSERMYSLHPKKRNLPLVAVALTAEVKDEPEPGALLREIEECHAAWCSSADWTKGAAGTCRNWTSGLRIAGIPAGLPDTLAISRRRSR
jgi:uncharacterized protein YdaU (DUF1376 family)